MEKKAKKSQKTKQNKIAKSQLLQKLPITQQINYNLILQQMNKYINSLDQEDPRFCCTCYIVGDHIICGCLLPLDEHWIHLNCLT